MQSECVQGESEQVIALLQSGLESGVRFCGRGVHVERDTILTKSKVSRPLRLKLLSNVLELLVNPADIR
jgi:hypothetical protein